MRRTQMDETFAVLYNEMCRYIIYSTFSKIKNILHDEDWDEEEIWLNAIFNMMIDINNGDVEEKVARKTLNGLLQNGFDVDIKDLLQLNSTIRTACKQELLAVQITRIAFESGASPEATYLKVKEILS